MIKLINLFILLLTLSSINLFSQTETNPVVPKPEEKKKLWYETMSIKGYSQLRYTHNPEAKTNVLGFRRSRLVFSGSAHDRLNYYIQLDYNVTVNSVQNFVNLRDAYFDFFLDKKKEFRLRFGESKVPFGFDNLQSSQNRPALERSEAINSAAPGERDLGFYVIWTPEVKKKLFKSLVDDGLKGTGDYGVLTAGAYNGQIINRADKNDQMHIVARVAYPLEIGTQIIEPSASVYGGRYVVESFEADMAATDDHEYDDQRACAAIVLFPKPVGVIIEGAIGKGPAYNPETDSLETRDLEGAYITLMYKTKIKEHVLLPFIRGQYFKGARKTDKNNPFQQLHELEMGIEWSPIKNFEITPTWVISHKRFEDFENEGALTETSYFRLQLQFNY